MMVHLSIMYLKLSEFTFLRDCINKIGHHNLIDRLIMKLVELFLPCTQIL